ncbi:hypothetical protein Wildcat_8 [Mycobacterium phage Wildcat]|uniref:tRNA nucleotidyltransferase n=2 Tax=Mycobacterium virus Wildcat TaxID=1993859 RepID=Q19Y52_9CAUD|nr:tRNA nucleotidyltransferase [Mycobacterium phage Wildcat]ABE67613.1 hypothetical protein Wildcat_8 [Mycobacterium phage Wildcat]QGJ89898.1 tRNA nucleotidyltransferase [Mycobacterium phage MaryV]
MNHYFELCELAKLFAPHKIYLVGGTVRDMLLGRESQDIDIATDAPPEVSSDILRKWGEEFWDPGVRFGTVCAKKGDMEVQVTTFRAAEDYTQGDRHPKVQWGSHIENDLLRRDFTINAIAQHIDPDGHVTWTGRAQAFSDINRRILRTPINPIKSFTDDPLRLIRAARFQAQLPDFSVATETWEGMESCAPHIRNVASERIVAELEKMLLAPQPFKGAILLESTGIAQILLPESAATPILNTVDADLDIRWAVWLFTTPWRQAEKALKRLKVDKRTFTRVPRLLRLLEIFHAHEIQDTWSPSKVRRFKVEAKDDLLAVEHLAYHTTGARRYWLAESVGGASAAWHRYVPQSSGEDVIAALGIAEGREVGVCLKQIQERIFREGRFFGKGEELEWLKEWRAL